VKLDSPYKGLDAFGESDLDALLFFGREREREIVVANLIAARLTVLYGPTGVGKSSLLRAGVARALRELPEEPLVVVFDRWGDDPSVDLAVAVADASGESVGDGLVDVVERAQRAGDLYLILDQAEEFFVYQGEDATFDVDLARIVGEPLRVNVLLSLREDSLAKLDRFKPRIPFVYANSLRLDRLDREEGRTAIVRPVERWNELEGATVAVDSRLVEAVLDGVRAGGIEQGGGLGQVDGNGRPASVEAPYLQLVMQRLWDVERAAGSQELRAETLEELGGARQVVADHLELAIADLTPEQQDVAAHLFTFLVTPSGTKIAHHLPDLAEYAGISEAEAAPVVETLSRHRILRPDEAGRTEIFHDVLAAEVLGWRRGYAAVRALEQERAASRRRHRRLAWIAGGAVVAFLAMSLLTVFAFSQRSQARTQADEAKAHQLEADAGSVLTRDPELGLLLAVEAARLAPSESTEVTLRDALLGSRVRALLSIGGSLLDATIHNGKVRVATASGDMFVVMARSGQTQSRVSTRVPAADASFSDDGTALLTGQDGLVRVVAPDGAVTTLPTAGYARAAELSHDGRVAAVIEATGVRLVDVDTGAVRRFLPHRNVLSVALSSDDRLLATGGRDEVLLWSALTGKRLRTLPHQRDQAVGVAFSPDGALVAAGSTDGLGRIWDVQDGSMTGTMPGHSNALTGVAFSADAEHVVTSSRDGSARIFKADTGAPLIVLAGHQDSVASAEFSGGAGSRVVTASRDGTARIWDALFQPELVEVARLTAPVRRVGFIRHGVIRAETDARAYVLNASTGKTLRTTSVTHAVGAHRRVFVCQNGEGAIVRGNTVVLRRNGRATVLRGHSDRITSVSFSPDGTTVATASLDRDVRLWDAATGDPGPVLAHNSPVYDAEFSPDGRWVVTAAGRVGLWDASSGRLVLRLQGHDGIVKSAAFDPTGRAIVSGGDDHTVRKYSCRICGGIDELVELAQNRLAAVKRELTSEERAKYLG
jgi:WD40 repeat protein